MIKVLISLLVMILSLTGCKSVDVNYAYGPTKGEDYYIEFDNYDNLASYINSLYEGKYSDKLIKDYQFGGVIKKKYVITGMCRCDGSHSLDDHKSLCPYFSVYKYLEYCYTDENNCFILEYRNFLDKLDLEIYKLNPYLDANGEADSYFGLINGKSNPNSSVIFRCYAKENIVSEDELYNVRSVYTQEEANSLYDLVCKEISNLQKERRDYYAKFDSVSDLNLYYNDVKWLEEFQIKGAVKLEYAVCGICRCHEYQNSVEVHDGNYTNDCPTFYIEFFKVIVYTDEDKFFTIKFKEPIKPSFVFRLDLKKILIDGKIVEYQGFLNSEGILFEASAIDNNDSYNYVKWMGCYTEEEAIFWYNAVYDALVQIQKNE